MSETTHGLPTFVLPGLDGGVRMLAEFRRVAPRTHDVSLIELPPGGVTYAELADHFSGMLAKVRDAVLIAESFSGPLAVTLASRYPESVACLVLVASFATSPVPRIAHCVPWRLVSRLPIPSFVARRYLLGRDCDRTLVADLQSAVRSVSADVLSGRLRQVMHCDVSEQLREIACPILYLRPSDDALVPRRCVDAVSHLRPDAEIRTLEGSHLILQTQPKQSWQTIADFTRIALRP